MKIERNFSLHNSLKVYINEELDVDPRRADDVRDGRDDDRRLLKEWRFNDANIK